MNTFEIDKEYVAGTYRRFPVEIVSGKGSVVKDPEGKEYIDLGSGIGVTAFGIADDLWQQAVTDQISRVQHMSNLYYTEPCAKLAQLLCGKTGMKKVFFSNSGAEANECAIKIARKYAADRWAAKKAAEAQADVAAKAQTGEDCPPYTIVTLRNSFHGRTLTTLAATGQDHFHELFQPLTPGFAHVAANDIDELKDLASKTPIAGVMIECVQGEGGVIALDRDYIREVREFTEENDIIMIVDEVQTGNGRTGELYAYMNFGIQPDVVSTAKGLAGGLPLGATLMSEKVQNVLGFGDHGSTFGGNPVCCAAALSIVSRIDESLLEEVRQKSRYIFETLEGAPGVESVTGLGLMIGIKTVKPAAEVVGKCIENGVLCLTAKDKVRLLPALNIPMEVLAKAVEVIKEACR
ncbi:MAG: aminotransferase class III-fold pyridoxal phosphate-dependent enzyme [Parasporobacterium sp.]|nr:aminotransferase class III-fold pyridoxal phosphate-dependent enzyme [Parasporobacterium sp.]